MIRTDRSHLYVAARSHPGMSGKNNEDNFAVSAYFVSKMNPTPSVFAIVSDGIGGHSAGEIASELVVNLISEAVEKREGGHPVAVFQNSFYRASEAIFAQAEQDPARKGMGATAACAWVIGLQLYIAYAGDSRIYLIRGNSIQQLTRDHTWVQEALEKGIIDNEGLKSHPNLHVIRRYLGSSEPPEPDLRLFLSPNDTDARARANQGMLLEPGDVILLCTDGLTDLVEAQEIRQALNGRTLAQTAEALIALANERGGHDNITVVLLGVPPGNKREAIAWVPG
ncbi:MAG: protein phosphatase 2C domain-containing protein [Anaerolineales bacterium]|nr:protein phosphatase 2C domain-containing protein [Anaerolineales bacterium]MCX7753772.1 protein phosphatase 2C domain-containing protein [Anaerolineales bacterium]MDW8279411.1 protein phosphatase 2C domain-containing protein [Anaerolineales bacterium]